VVAVAGVKRVKASIARLNGFVRKLESWKRNLYWSTTMSHATTFLWTPVILRFEKQLYQIPGALLSETTSIIHVEI